MPGIYRPRMAASIRVPIVGSIQERIAMAEDDSVVELPMRVHTGAYVRNDHNHADSCKLIAEWFDAGIDPRIFSSCTCRFWLGNAADDGTWQPNDADLRFAGVVTRVGRIMQNEGSGFTVELDFDDYTAFFLESKPFPPEGVPDFSQTLSQAWARICDHTGPIGDDGQILSTVGALRDRIVFRGKASDVLVGKGVPVRFQKIGKVVPKADTDAWSVWQQVVGAVGLVSFMHLDQCIVTTMTDYYTSVAPPVLVFGQNIAAIEETRDIKFSGKGIGLTSFDPLTGTTIESLWPPVGDKRVKRKKVGASRASKSTASRAKPKPAPTQDQVRKSEDREYFDVPGVTDQSVLDTYAERVWEERSRQELEGTVTTGEMVVERTDGTAFDILGLAGGDALRIEFDPEHIFEIGQLTDFDARVARAVDLGYSEQVAEVVARNLGEFAKLDSIFHVKSLSVHAETASTSDDGQFRVEIHFVNRIEIDQSGNATKPANAALDAMKDPTKLRQAIASMSPDDAQALLDNPKFLDFVQQKIKGP